jgi:hypothetical protein
MPSRDSQPWPEGPVSPSGQRGLSRRDVKDGRLCAHPSVGTGTHFSGNRVNRELKALGLSDSVAGSDERLLGFETAGGVGKPGILFCAR